MAIKKKTYKSRREKYERDKRNFQLFVIFGLMALIVTFIKNRKSIYDWFMFNVVDRM